MRSKRLTFGEHVELGERLKEAHEALVCASVQVGNAYTKTDQRRISRALNALDAARCWLDDRVFEEHPAQANPAIYYGTSKRYDEARKRVADMLFVAPSAR